MVESEDAFRVLVGNPEEQRPLGRYRIRWENNINMCDKEAVCGDGLKLPRLIQGLVADFCECCSKPSVSIKCGKFLG
jgi:hypothetical protein